MTTARSLILPIFLTAVFVCILSAAPIAHAQLQDHTAPVPVIPGMSGAPPPGSDPLMRRLNERMAIVRNNQRQKKIASDSAHLLNLAQKLNSDVVKSNKDELSVSVVKEAEEIEKLAKSIKDKMRDGY